MQQTQTLSPILMVLLFILISVTNKLWANSANNDPHPKNMLRTRCTDLPKIKNKTADQSTAVLLPGASWPLS